MILLTGGSGLVGRALAPLLREKHAVCHFDRQDPGDGLPWIPGDLRDVRAVEAACRGADIIIHAAALHGRAWDEAGDETAFAVNVTGIKNILEAAAKHQTSRVVFTSSIYATGHKPYQPDYLPIDENIRREPCELYGLTKKLGEQICAYYTRRYGFSTICLRPGGIRPAGDAPGTRWERLFGAVDVRDVAQAHVLAAEAGEDLQHEVFVITADTPLAAVNPDAYQRDCCTILEGLYPGITRLMNDEQRKAFATQEWYTIKKAQAMLGYQPQHNFTGP